MSMSPPLVSIIMNCYNGERFLRQAIDSVYAQSFRDWEIIFWDNGSTDNSAAIAQSYDQRLRYFLAEKTTPLGEARNLALQQVRGRYLAFLDTDDCYLPHKLATQVAQLEQEDIALCYSSAIFINEDNRVIRHYRVREARGDLLATLLERYEINMQSVMLRYQLLQDEGLQFDTSLHYCPDRNLFQLIAARYPIAAMSEPLVQYRIVKGSLSSKTVDLAASEIGYTLDKLVAENPGIVQRCAQPLQKAYDKLHYYRAIAALTHRQRREAQSHIDVVRWKRWQYLLLSLLISLPLPPQWLLRLVKR
ncbi:MAG: glycosyltransferase [Gammaproteobacteria bacterium]|nr:glycosyltransferase [Gammaproteobacteria bacterium]